MGDETSRTNRLSGQGSATQVALRLFEVLAGLLGMTRDELLKNTLDMAILQNASDLKRMLQVQLEGLKKLESGGSAGEVDAEIGRVFDRRELAEGVEVRVPAGRGTELYLRTISRLTGKDRQALLEEALGRVIEAHAGVLREQFGEYLAYIEDLEAGQGMLDSDVPGF